MGNPTALVLSAGGMYGAYQAGAWEVLAERLRPDLLVGVSAGAINAWAIAAEVRPGELVESWLNPGTAALARLRWPVPPWRGVFDSAPLHDRLRDCCLNWHPRRPLGVVAVDLARMQPRLFTEGVDWRHLAASSAVLFGYELVRIEGRTYCDGGLYQALPLWAAEAMGAGRIVALNVLPYMPSVVVRSFVGGLRRLAPAASRRSCSLPVFSLGPEKPLGPLRQAVFWRREAVESWVERGRRDARAALQSGALERFLRDN